MVDKNSITLEEKMYFITNENVYLIGEFLIGKENMRATVWFKESNENILVAWSDGDNSIESIKELYNRNPEPINKKTRRKWDDVVNNTNL